jgi:glycosyltransferase involved in cell wall biosynthesis
VSRRAIVILTEAVPDYQTARTLEQVRAGLGADFDLVHQTVTAGIPRFAGQLVRVRQLCRKADLVHCFCPRALRLASLLSPAPILYTPLPSDRPATIRWMLSAREHRTIRLVAMDAASHRFYIEQGFPADSSVLIRTGVRMTPASRDPAIRKRLGLRENDFAVLAVGASEPSSNHPLSLHALGILHAMNRRFRLIAWGKGRQAAQLHSFADGWKFDVLIDASRILGDDVSFDQLPALADAALITAPERVAIAPILTCMAGSLPIVGPATFAVSDLLEDRHTALLYSPPKPKVIAQHVLHLSEDAALRAKLADHARAEAYELFSVSRFLDELRQVYLS